MQMPIVSTSQLGDLAAGTQKSSQKLLDPMTLQQKKNKDQARPGMIQVNALGPDNKDFYNEEILDVREIKLKKRSHRSQRSHESEKLDKKQLETPRNKKNEIQEERRAKKFSSQSSYKRPRSRQDGK